MTSTGKGWILFVAALGMMTTLMSVEVYDLMHWQEAVQPHFVAKIMVHFGTVVSAFVAGKLIPTEISI
tara:strand:- start:1519 stop:1722 length:204 start_codon:yes stop_codon:yes gene_type:complete